MENDSSLMISGIKHFAYCKRRWALVHIEQLWSENMYTVDGELMHETVHDGEFNQTRGSTVLSRGMAVASQRLNINGVCDMVELISDDNGINITGKEGKYRVYPVEYKRGSPGDRSDSLQLCAQAVCLEEMLCTDIPAGAVYYGQTKHRQEILLTAELRAELEATVAEMHKYFDRHYTPKVKRKSSCTNCSMVNYCLPQLLKTGSAKDYLNNAVKEDTDA